MRAFGIIISMVGMAIIVLGILMLLSELSAHVKSAGIIIAATGSAWLIFGLFLGCLADIRKYLEEIRNALCKQRND